MYEQKIVFTIEGPEGRLDEITFQASDGAILVDSTNTKKHNPQVAVSQLVAVRLEDSDAGTFDPAAFVRGIPSHRRGVVMRYVASVIAKQERARLTSVYLDNDEPAKDEA